MAVKSGNPEIAKVLEGCLKTEISAVKESNPGLVERMG